MPADGSKVLSDDEMVKKGDMYSTERWGKKTDVPRGLFNGIKLKPVEKEVDKSTRNASPWGKNSLGAS